MTIVFASIRQGHPTCKETRMRLLALGALRASCAHTCMHAHVGTYAYVEYARS